MDFGLIKVVRRIVLIDGEEKKTLKRSGLVRVTLKKKIQSFSGRLRNYGKLRKKLEKNVSNRLMVGKKGRKRYHVERYTYGGRTGGVSGHGSTNIEDLKSPLPPFSLAAIVR